MYATFLFDPSQLSLVSSLPPAVGSTQLNAPHFRPTAGTGEHTPITVAACFEELALATRDRVQSVGAQQIVLPPQYAQRASTNGKFNLTAEAWPVELVTGQAQLRMVKIDGGKSNIINTWIFPVDPRNTPVYAAELIGVGDVVRVAFIDIQAPLTSAQTTELQRQLQLIAQKYVDLPRDEAAPDWAIEASLGHYTYARNVPDSSLAKIRAAYLEYLSIYLAYANATKSNASSSISLTNARQQLHDYQMHHMHHSPGKKFLGNLFGVDWTERFMLDFLFTQP